MNPALIDEFAGQVELTSPDIVSTRDQPALQQFHDRFDAWMQTLHTAWVE